MSASIDALWREVAALRALIGRSSKQSAAHIADFVPITATSSNGSSDAVATVAPFPDQRAHAGQQTAQRIEPWGLRSRSVVNNIYGLIVRVLGGGSNPALVGVSAPGYGPDDLEAGETALYCMADGTLVKLTKVGKIEINSATGQPVAIAAGSDVTITANAGAGTVDINATSITCGPVGNLPVLVSTLSFDSMGVPVTQVGCTNALKAG